MYIRMNWGKFNFRTRKTAQKENKKKKKKEKKKKKIEKIGHVLRF
jgi:hypothetical protein